MYQFDESFLDSVGLSGMPEEQKQSFLQYAQDQLEVRIGEKMSEGLSDDQLDEFERIIDNDEATVQKWLADLGDYKNDDTYKKLLDGSEDEEDSPQFLADYVTAKWLDQNCPQYQDIIKESIEGLQAEISSQKEEILANA